MEQSCSTRNIIDKMSKKMRAVSIRADKAYIQSLRALADALEQHVGDMVRQACDREYGKQLEPYLSFFAHNGIEIFQIEQEVNGEASND